MKTKTLYAFTPRNQQTKHLQLLTINPGHQNPNDLFQWSDNPFSTKLVHEKTRKDAAKVRRGYEMFVGPLCIRKITFTCEIEGIVLA